MYGIKFSKLISSQTILIYFSSNRVVKLLIVLRISIRIIYLFLIDTQIFVKYFFSKN